MELLSTVKKLTIIIPFLNEGEEINNTLKNIMQNGGSETDILLINDASDDGFDYECIIQKFKVDYIKHKQRLGVAASRDEGVECCRTPYFLLLDGHMRFYTDNWVQSIVLELEKDERVLLCCQTKVLYKEDGIVCEREIRRAFGARVNFDRYDPLPGERWIYREMNPDSVVEDIPCVLGAAYAASRKYWLYLKGLKGLESFGSDETYISLKVWLEGGTCKLLKNIVVGHIYRYKFPYTVVKSDMIYNRMLIANLLFSPKFKYNTFEALKRAYCIEFIQAYEKWRNSLVRYEPLKEYYQKIFTQTFDKVVQLNLDRDETELPVVKDDIFLYQTVRHLILDYSQVSTIGLVQGRMGIVLALFHYAEYSGQPVYSDLASDLLDRIYEQCHSRLSVDLNGICGLGWGIEYLVQHGFVEGDTEEILAEIDEKVMERDPLRLQDYSLETGLGGIIHYVTARLKSSSQRQGERPFDQNYLDALVLAAHRLLKDENTFFSVAITMQFLDGLHSGKWDTESLTIGDLIVERVLKDKLPPFEWSDEIAARSVVVVFRLLDLC